MKDQSIMQDREFTLDNTEYNDGCDQRMKVKGKLHLQ